MSISEGFAPGEITDVKTVDASGVATGTISNPVRIDPTGTTPQPSSQSGTWNITNVSGTVSLPTGAATSANQTTANSSLSSIDGKLTGVSTAANQTTGNASLSSIDTKVTGLALETTQQTTNTRIGDLTETAPGTDTASSGLNGRLQRIAQGITSLITAITDRTQKTQLTNGTIDVAVSAGIPGLTSNGLVIRHIPYEPPTFVAYGIGVTNAANKSMLSILNADATLKVKIKKIQIHNVQTTAVAGAAITYSMRRITGHSAGTQLTTTLAAAGNISPMDTTDTLDADITVRTGGTMAGEDGFDRMQWKFSTDEWGSGTLDEEGLEKSFMNHFPIYQDTDEMKSLVLNQNQGINLRQNGSVTTGSFNFVIWFTVES